MIWTRIKSRVDAEPVAVMGVITAGIALATAFGVPVTQEQAGAITAFAAAVLSVWARRKVTPYP